MNRLSPIIRFGLALFVTGALVVVAGICLRLAAPARTRTLLDEYMPLRFRHALQAAAIFMAAHSATATAGNAPGGSSGTVAPVRATAVGINVAAITHFSTQRAFANLAIGSFWLGGGSTSYFDLPAGDVTPDGGVAAVPAGSYALLGLALPDTGPDGATIRCTWLGRGTVTVSNGATGLIQAANSLQFHWTNTWKNIVGVDLRVMAVDPHNPIHHIDCRETTIPRDAVFDPAFVKSLQGFKTIRFMDWQRTNENGAVTWASRNQPYSILYALGDGVPVEHMLALANEVGADPWFCMPWNADASYLENFARYVHDHLPAGRKVYVETSNEIWNTAFPATNQAIAEGLAEKLSPNPGIAGLYRYAEKTSAVMAIWTQIFADRPGALVRVAASQQNVPFRSETVLGYRDTAAHIDAWATSAYFGEVMREGVTDNLDEIFRRLNSRVDETINAALVNQAVARKYGKPYLTYEAGQAMAVYYAPALMVKIERDQRMYGIYRKFLSDWRSKVGGALNLYDNVGEIKGSGAWGLQEHSGQPLAEAPKLRAVVDDRGG